jgi:hypothetical protein
MAAVPKPTPDPVLDALDYPTQALGGFTDAVFTALNARISPINSGYLERTKMLAFVRMWDRAMPHIKDPEKVFYTKWHTKARYKALECQYVKLGKTNGDALTRNGFAVLWAQYIRSSPDDWCTIAGITSVRNKSILLSQRESSGSTRMLLK